MTNKSLKKFKLRKYQIQHNFGRGTFSHSAGQRCYTSYICQTFLYSMFNNSVHLCILMHKLSTDRGFTRRLVYNIIYIRLDSIN